MRSAFPGMPPCPAFSSKTVKLQLFHSWRSGRLNLPILRPVSFPLWARASCMHCMDPMGGTEHPYHLPLCQTFSPHHTRIDIRGKAGRGRGTDWNSFSSSPKHSTFCLLSSSSPFSSSPFHLSHLYYTLLHCFLSNSFLFLSLAHTISYHLYLLFFLSLSLFLLLSFLNFFLIPSWRVTFLLSHSLHSPGKKTGLSILLLSLLDPSPSHIHYITFVSLSVSLAYMCLPL